MAHSDRHILFIILTNLAIFSQRQTPIPHHWVGGGWSCSNDSLCHHRHNNSNVCKLFSQEKCT